MTDRPILFSKPMVLALLASAKTQTRRLAKAKRGTTLADFTVNAGPVPGGIGTIREIPPEKLAISHAVGDRLWVREAWRADVAYDEFSPSKLAKEVAIWFDADGSKFGDGVPGRLRPGMFMMRHVSRLTLPVTEVRVQRLQDITEDDAIAEGIVCQNVIIGTTSYGRGPVEITADRYFFDGCDDEGFEDSVSAYAALWDSINGAGAWDKNPWVVATSFTVEKN